MDGGPSGAGNAADGVLGHPRVHLRRTGSTNERARALASAGAPHGTLVSAAEQTAGRGRQGRVWSAPACSSLLCSLVLRWPIDDRSPALLSLIAAVAVCDAVGERARVKWPNDVVVERPGADALPGAPPARAPSPTRATVLAKLAGILVEGRPQERWAVLGIGVNVAVRVHELPAEVRERAASLERAPSATEPLLEDLLSALTRRLGEPAEGLLDAWRARDALCGREVSWRRPGPAGHVDRGRADGIDSEGRLLVRLEDGTRTTLGAGEVHLI